MSVTADLPDMTAGPSAWGARLRRLHGDLPRLELSGVELVRELREESLVAVDRDRAGRRISIAKSARS